MEEEDRDERGSTENHDSDQDLEDLDEKMTDVADTLANMSSHPAQSSSQSRSRNTDVVWDENADISTPPSSSQPISSPSPSPSHRFTPDLSALDILNWLWGDCLLCQCVGCLILSRCSLVSCFGCLILSRCSLVSFFLFFLSIQLVHTLCS